MAEVKIEIFRKKNLDEINHLLKEYQFKPYYFLKQLKLSDTLSLFNGLLNKAYLNESNFLLVAKEKNKHLGFLLLEKQAWDSSFFGFECYNIEHIFAEGVDKAKIDIKRRLFGSVLSLCKEKKIYYLNVKADTQDRTSIHVLESAQFSLVAEMLHLVYVTSNRRQHFKQLGKVRPYMPGDLESLRKIARVSMRYDHFHSDCNFSKETSDRVYQSLIENCCKGILADKVFVVERGGKIVGYVACQICYDVNNTLPMRIGNIRHLAVSYPDGFGCGPGLQEVALDWFQDKVEIVESKTTIQNLPIIKISVKSNMNIVASFLRFSRWIDV